MKKIEVNPNMKGYLYKNNKFEEELNPGVYSYFLSSAKINIFSIPTIKQQNTVFNQEALSSDNIAFKFSFIIDFSIVDGRKVLNNFSISKDYVAGYPGSNWNQLSELRDYISNKIQVFVKENISQMKIEEINSNHAKIVEISQENLENSFLNMGIEIKAIYLKDLMFSKKIQEIFSKKLDSKISSEVSLENARSEMATSRILKNVAKLYQNDSEMKFLKYMEILDKAADGKGNTFVVNDNEKY